MLPISMTREQSGRRRQETARSSIGAKPTSIGSIFMIVMSSRRQNSVNRDILRASIGVRSKVKLLG